MDHLAGLNDRQKEAVLHTEGPLLIIAGAGAGKTKTITHRILHLIKSGVSPNAILAITFTNKAGKEMRERVMKLLHEDKTLNSPVGYDENFLEDSPATRRANVERPFVSTFHSLGVHILRQWPEKFGLTKHFAIFDRSDSKRAVKEAVKDRGLDPQQYEPAKILGIISREKGAMVTLAKFAETADRDYMRGIVRDVWERYEATLAREKALDFDDLILKTALLLRDDEEVRTFYQDLWQYVHIDEYQDTNRVQYTIARMLSQKNRHICVVGDADQTIYTWRGATIDNILNFEKDYPEAKIVTLEQNYRSTKTIISVANSVIEKNEKRLKKTLFTEGEQGDKVRVYDAFDEGDEARWIAETSRELINDGTDPKQIAVLYRANFQSRAIEEQMLRKSVPYQVLGTRFFDRKEVKDILSYIRLSLNPESVSDLARVANEPARGIGKVTLMKMIEGRDGELSGKTADSVARFRAFIKKLGAAAQTEKPSEIVKLVLKGAGFEAAFEDEGDEGAERLENVKELVSLALAYDFMPAPTGVESLLSDASLATDQDDLNKDNGGVKLMTVHASKGLEFDAVFIAGMEEGLFPHEGMGGNKDEKRDNEEERRLFYVALTRARKRLFLSHAHMRTIFGQKDMHAPSSFLDDVAEEHIEQTQVDPDSRRRSAIKEIFIDF